jgi:argininosuccinate synthase
MERIVLAYSGGLGSSVAIRRLGEQCDAEVVAVTMDLGERAEPQAIRDQALAAGAVRAHVLDVREEFACEHFLPALKADVTCENGCPMGRAIGQALIAAKLVEIASIEQATTVAHGCTEGSDQERIETCVRALNPAIKIIPAAREERLGDFWTPPPDRIRAQMKAPFECPAEAAYVEISFERGVPIAINGVAMPLMELIESLRTIAGAYGVGRIDSVENRVIDEAPDSVVLHLAHNELQRLVTTAEAARFSRSVSLEYAEIVRKGLWYSPLREALDAYIAKTQERVSGAVRLKLSNGDCRVVSKSSPFATLMESSFAWTSPAGAGSASVGVLAKSDH